MTPSTLKPGTILTLKEWTSDAYKNIFPHIEGYELNVGDKIILTERRESLKGPVQAGALSGENVLMQSTLDRRFYVRRQGDSLSAGWLFRKAETPEVIRDFIFKNWYIAIILIILLIIIYFGVVK